MTSELGSAVVVALTYGVAVAVAAVPVVVLAFVLASSSPTPVGLGFAGGWALGLVAALGLVVAVADVAVAASDGSDPPPNQALAWVRIVAGVGLLALAARSWGSRGSAKEPRWMAGVAGWGPRKAFTTGLALGAVNPKNLAIVAGAASALLDATTSPALQVPAVLVFAVVGSVGVAGPVLYRLVGGAAALQALERGNRWLQARATALSAVVLAVLGVIVLVNGVTAL